MSTETKKSRIRTFARDLEAARTKQSEASSAADAGDAKKEAPVSAPQQPQPSQYAQAPRDLPEIEREPAPKPDEPTSDAPDSRSKDEERKAKPPTPPQKPIPPKAPPAKKEPKKSVPKKDASTPIPAFHELQKQAQETLKQEAAKAEPDANVPNASGEKASGTRPNLGGYGATVIRDTKHKRFKLFPSLIKSIKGWFGNLTRKKRATPKYTVSDTDRRKGVIQKATAKSGAIFTADNDTLRDQIRRRRAATETKESPKWESRVASEPAAAPDTDELTWTPNTETGYALLEEPDDEAPSTEPRNVTVEYKQRTPQPAPEPVPQAALQPATEPTPATPTAAPAAGKSPTVDDPVSRPDGAPAAAQPTQDTPSTTADENTESSAAPDQADTTPAPEPQTSPQPDEAPTAERSDRPLPEVDVNDTNTLSLIITFILAAVVVLGLVVWNYVQPLNSTAPAADTSVTTPTVSLPGAQTDRLTITANQALVPAIKASAAEHSQGVIDVQIYNQSNEVVAPPIIMELLQFDVIPSFRQSLTDVRYVTVNRSEPILVFRFTDQTTIRGGFLSWEPSMANDLDGLYDVAPTATFVDEQVAGTDVRVLRSADESGAVQFVYGFVDENTALITRTREDFAHIVELTKSE